MENGDKVMTISDMINLISHSMKNNLSKLDAPCRLFNWPKVNLL